MSWKGTAKKSFVILPKKCINFTTHTKKGKLKNGKKVSVPLIHSLSLSLSLFLFLTHLDKTKTSCYRFFFFVSLPISPVLPPSLPSSSSSSSPPPPPPFPPPPLFSFQQMSEWKLLSDVPLFFFPCQRKEEVGRWVR
jgi:hypothetical protein